MNSFMMHSGPPAKSSRTPGRILPNLAGIFFLLTLVTGMSNAQCTDYCSAGSFTWDVTQSSSFCFNVPDGYTATICMEARLTYVGGTGCSPTATYTLGIFNSAGQRADSACASPFNWDFEAQYAPYTGYCPNGQGVRCCVAFCPQDLYVKIVDANGNDKSGCFTGYVKCCITCVKKYTGGPCTQ